MIHLSLVRAVAVVRAAGVGLSRLASIFGFAVVTGVLAPSQTAQAALLSVDLLAAGDGLATRDTETGLEWLDLTATMGLSFDDVIGGAGGWTALGFKTAKQTQVDALYRNAGIDLGVSEMNGIAISRLIALMGCTRSCGSPELGSGAAGLADLDIFDPTTAVEMFIETFPSPEDPAALLGEGSRIGGDVFGFLFFKDVATPGIGVYLYRSVPEPKTVTLLLLGSALLLTRSLRRPLGMARALRPPAAT